MRKETFVGSWCKFFLFFHVFFAIFFVITYFFTFQLPLLFCVKDLTWLFGASEKNIASPQFALKMGLPAMVLSIAFSFLVRIRKVSEEFALKNLFLSTLLYSIFYLFICWAVGSAAMKVWIMLFQGISFIGALFLLFFASLPGYFLFYKKVLYKY